MWKPKPHILIADDSAANRDLLQKILQGEGFETTTAVNGRDALEQIQATFPDVVLLDLEMPDLNGIEVLKELRSKPDWGLLPVILVTEQSAIEDRVRGLDAGASDFLTKPVDISELLARVRAQQRVKQLTDELDRTEEVLFTLAKAIEARDAYTLEHTERVAQQSLAIGRKMGLTPVELEALQRGAQLHDIGMIALPDSILQKPGPLDDEEWKRMRQHPTLGAEMVGTLRSSGEALEIILHHHERWDGLGYPAGLAGEDIPILARIVAVADSFDAMTSDRFYRQRRTVEQALELLRRGAGKEWDPKIVALAQEVLDN